MRWLGSAAAVAVGLLLASCRFIPTTDVPTLADANAPSGSGAFDPDKMVASMWSSRVVPYFEKKAGRLLEVRDLAAKSPEEAGRSSVIARNRKQSPWTFVVRFEASSSLRTLSSRAATITVDASGQGKGDAIVQIGPAMRGTAIRDALDFVSFGDFTNQIDFARFGKSFNTYVNRITLEKLPRDGLMGRKVTVLGAYPFVSAAETPLVTPAEISIGPKS